MKFVIVILILNVHVHAESIFGDFRDVMSSLENSFQKMITDVVTDVRDTIDCTVEAVENALSLGSTIANPKCRGAVKEYQDKDGYKKSMTLNIPSDTSFNIHRNGDYMKDISKPKEYSNQNMKYKLPNDGDRFANIKIFLKDELEKMSANMRSQFKELESDEKSALDAVIQYINILHTMKHNSKNDSEVNEAKRILDGATKILNVNVKATDTDDSKFDKLLTTVQGSNHDKVDVTKTLSKIAENKFTNGHNASNTIPGTFKDLFNKALGTTHIKDNNEERNKNVEVKRSSFNQIDLSHDIENSVESMDYESLLGSHSESNKDAIDDATKILEDSKRTNSILNNFFANAAQAGSDIFGNSEPF